MMRVISVFWAGQISPGLNRRSGPGPGSESGLRSGRRNGSVVRVGVGVAGIVIVGVVITKGVDKWAANRGEYIFLLLVE